MSSSSKKKLRKEQNNEILTERQKQAKAEARSTKLLTVSFIVTIALIVAVFVGSLVVNLINKSGIIEKNTTVALVGSISSMGNLGPGFGHIIGPMGNFDSLQPETKLIFMIDMLAGRLELIPFLVLFQKDLWSFRSE